MPSPLPSPGLRAAVALVALALAPPARAGAEAAREEAPGAEVAVKVVDRELVDQDGQRLRFGRDVVADHVVVVNFVYTTCTTICPLMSAQFSRLQARLGDRLGRDVRLVSISLDPVRDTPARLRAYAARYGARPGWIHLGGAKDDVEEVLRGLGAYTPDYASHAPMLLVGDGRSGRFVRMNGWPKPEQVLARVDALRAAPAAAEESPEEAKARAYFTDTELLTQDGERVRFYGDVLRGHVVCLSFVFTRCKDACPLIVQKLNRVRKELGDRFGNDVRFVSFSVDPEYDTPQALRRFAEKQQALAPGWTFLTGPKESVKVVLGQLGEWVDEPGDHSTAFIAGNARTRHWSKVRPDAPPWVVAETLRRLAEEDAPGAGATGVPQARSDGAPR